MNPTKETFMLHLDNVGVPGEQYKSEGGPVPDSTKKYGRWLRRHRFDQFLALYHAWIESGSI